jgi:hypothetical protein
MWPPPAKSHIPRMRLSGVGLLLVDQESFCRDNQMSCLSRNSEVTTKAKSPFSVTTKHSVNITMVYESIRPWE